MNAEVVELRREFLEQVAVLQHVGYVVCRVPDKREARFRANGRDAAREGLVRHVVFHDIDQRLVGRLLPSGKLVKGDYIPKANQPDPAVRIVDEELGNADLSSGDQDARAARIPSRCATCRSPWDRVRSDCSSAPQRGSGASVAGACCGCPNSRRVEPNALQEHVDPLLRRERLARLDKAVEVDAARSGSA